MAIGLALLMATMGYARGTTTARTSQAVVVSILSPASQSTVRVGDTLPLTVAVTGTGNTAVAWTVSAAHTDAVANGNFTLGFIPGNSPSTLYYAPEEIPAGNNPVTITATSKADPSKSASITVTVISDPQPNVISVTGNQTEVTGVDLNLSSSTPTLGLADVGLCSGALCSAGVASVTVPKGTTVTVWLLGQGLTSRNGTALATGLSISVSQGSTPDVKVFGVIAQPPFEGLTNIKFQVQVSAEAARGPRNLIVTNGDGDLQAFVGALLIP